MGIQIDCIRIANFRGLSNIEISLPRVAVLVGINNSGKTSIIKAIQLAIGDYYYRYPLTEEDFYIDKDGKRRNEIKIDYRIIPIDENGKRKKEFSEKWQQEFGESIQIDEEQYVAIRTIASPDTIKSGFKIDRFFLKKWTASMPNDPNLGDWQNNTQITLLKKRFTALSFIPIESQRDIYNELREKNSFIGRILSDIKYDDDACAELERRISEINESIVAESNVLKTLKNNLNQLNESFEGYGDVELTPLAKKLRDLHKRFSIHFSEVSGKTFSMEYHGMGTRSWASMLTMLAFTKNLQEKHEKDYGLFFPVMAAEEPEAHLHPNAQRTLYNQLIKSSGQIIISTHSPYLAGVSELSNLRMLVKRNERTIVTSLSNDLTEIEKKELQRSVMLLRGEILFARVIVLFEGITEEQVIPAMFEKYFSDNGYKKGVIFVSVGGMKYSPFIKMALNMQIPCCIISDNDKDTKQKIQKQIGKIKNIDNDIFSLHFLQQGNDFEAEIIENLKEEIKISLLNLELKDNTNEQYKITKSNDLNKLPDPEIVKEMRKFKSEYSSFLVDEIIKSNREAQDMIPKSIIEAFEKIKEWLK